MNGLLALVAAIHGGLGFFNFELALLATHRLVATDALRGTAPPLRVLPRANRCRPAPPPAKAAAAAAAAAATGQRGTEACTVLDAPGSRRRDRADTAGRRKKASHVGIHPRGNSRLVVAHKVVGASSLAQFILIDAPLTIKLITAKRGHRPSSGAPKVRLRHFLLALRLEKDARAATSLLARSVELAAACGQKTKKKPVRVCVWCKWHT